MRVSSEEDAQRVADAQEHDECLVMIGEDGGRPLIRLSVTNAGRGIIEFDTEEDLAAGIRQLSQLLSESTRSARLPGSRFTPAL